MNIDLTEAVKAARAVRLTDDDIFFNLDDQEHVFLGTASATAILAAALPHIARQVADSIAAKIQAEAERRRGDVNEVVAAWGGVDPGTDGVRFGVEVAARIAREAVR